MAPSIPKCACGCGRDVVRTGSRGPTPQYATDACRVRACRARHATSELEPYPGAVQGSRVTPTAASVDDQVERAVLEARAIALMLTRLGTVARPEFAWRCTKLGEAILKALLKTFGEATR